MPEPGHLLAETSALDEVIAAQLGDHRRNVRYADIIECLARRPDASIPEAMQQEAALEGYYRFMRNEAIDHHALLEPHFDETCQRAAELGRVLVVHDTTEMSFKVHDEPARQHLASPSSARQAFKWHASLVVAADGSRAPLGLLASRPFVHRSELPDEEARAFWEELGGVFENEKWRWMEGVEATEARLEEVEHPIHVIDREGDDFGLMFRMCTSDYRFVVRMTYNRRVCDGPARNNYQSLDEALEEVDWHPDEREVFLSARPKRKAADGHPVRRARKARLKIRATTLKLRRPDNVRAAHAPGRLEVNVVEVLEVKPPEDAEPVRWVLVTTESIASADELWDIVDIYRARWVIEEYFKALKTGTGYTDLQHKKAETLLNALSAKAIVAWDLLRLRHLGRHMPDADALEAVNEIQLSILKKMRPKMVGDDSTAADAMRAVAGLGGHISNNGPPGWMVLGRGWQHLLELEKGFRLAQQMAGKM